MSRTPVGVRSAIRFFAFYLANGTLAPDVLGAVDDYRPNLVEFGSELEMAFTIFMNVLELDEQSGSPVNEALAQRRAAQWIRRYCDEGYTVEPPFEPWETELH